MSDQEPSELPAPELVTYHDLHGNLLSVVVVQGTSRVTFSPQDVEPLIEDLQRALNTVGESAGKSTVAAVLFAQAVSAAPGDFG